MSITSVLRLFTNVTLLRHEFGNILQTFTTFRLLHLAFLKLRSLSHWLFESLGWAHDPKRALELKMQEEWIHSVERARTMADTTQRVMGPNGQMMDVPVP